MKLNTQNAEFVLSAAKRLGIGKEELEALIARGFAQQEKEDL